MDPPALSPDDVLAQATRARLFGLLGELKRPASTEELAERVGLHINGVRIHLERLRDAGLVTRTRARQAVGRPRDEWAIAPDARPSGEPPRAYADLGRWLALAIQPDEERLHDIEATGREIGRELAPQAGLAAAAEAMHATLASMGFAPDRRHGPEHRVVYCLRNCPYQVAARANQAVVCTLHRGMTRGLLDVLEPTARLADFVPHDPDAAGCIIDVDGLAATTEG